MEVFIIYLKHNKKYIYDSICGNFSFAFVLLFFLLMLHILGYIYSSIQIIKE